MERREFSNDKPVLSNDFEAECVHRLIQLFRTDIGQAAFERLSVGIISPYAGQIAKLKARIVFPNVQVRCLI